MLKIVSCILVGCTAIVFILFIVAWMCFTEDQYKKMDEDLKKLKENS